MSDLLTTPPIAEPCRETSTRDSLEAILATLAELEQLLLPLTVMASDDDTKQAPGDHRQAVSERLRLFASCVLIRAALPLISDLLDEACANAADDLRRKYGNTITPDKGWDDAIQETRIALEKRLRNLAVNARDCEAADNGEAIDKFEEYAYEIMHNLVRTWRRKACRQKPLAALLGGEESLAAAPDVPVESGEEEVESFCKFLDQQPQPNPALPMSQVLRVYRSCSHDRAAAAKALKISESELRNCLAAIRELAKCWSR